MGNFAYETLLARGFSKQQIQYLNPDATQLYDGDGDGYSDDIDGELAGTKTETLATGQATGYLGADQGTSSFFTSVSVGQM